MIQGSEEWHKARIGMITASRFKDAIAQGRSGGVGKTSENYAYEIVGEILTGEPADVYINAAMEWGLEQEPYAKLAYEEHTLNKIHETGFIEKEEMIGGSPDGLIGKDGMIEVKCPSSHIHARNLHNKKVPSEYVPQVQGLLWIAGRKWCDFVSYRPKCDLMIVRIDYDEKYVNELVEKLRGFRSFVKQILEEL